jgi:hypothetical protein
MSNDGVNNSFYTFDSYEDRDRLRVIWTEKINTDLRWFRPDDPVASMRNALILVMQDQLIDSNQWVRSAVQWRDFLMCVLAEEPYTTSHKGIIEMVSFAAQTCNKGSWEQREKLINKFLIVKKG